MQHITTIIIGQNDIIPKLMQPIVATICKVVTVKKPCLQTPHMETNLSKSIKTEQRMKKRSYLSYTKMVSQYRQDLYY